MLAFVDAIAPSKNVAYPSLSADLLIRWPNGNQENVAGVAADELVVIQEGSGIIRTEKFQAWPR